MCGSQACGHGVISASGVFAERLFGAAPSLPAVHPEGRCPDAPDEREQHEEVEQSANRATWSSRHRVRQDRHDLVLGRVLRQRNERQAADADDNKDWNQVHGVHVHDIHLEPKIFSHAVRCDTKNNGKYLPSARKTRTLPAVKCTARTR